jgi:hypothetical protein
MLKREPTLDDLLNDPVVRKVMKADGYSAEEIVSLMHQAGARTRASNCNSRPGLPAPLNSCRFMQ